MNAEKQFQVIHSNVGQRSVKNTSSYIADFRQTAVAQAKIVDGIRAGSVAQRYIVRGQGIDSDDGSIVDVENHFFYAEAGKKNTANDVLKAQNSKVELVELGGKTIGGKSYEQLTAKYADKSGDDMSITSDCGECCRSVMGNGTPHAAFLSPGFPPLYKTEGATPDKFKTELCSYVHNTAKKITPMQIIEIKKESRLLRKKCAKSNLSEVCTTMLCSLNTDMLCQVFDESPTLSGLYGVNQAANPRMGKGFVILSGGANNPGQPTWNFHWAGKVMESNNGKDWVSLENYAVSVGGRNIANTDWNFDMYGTEKTNQSFHKKHKGSMLHGRHPTTMIVE